MRLCSRHTPCAVAAGALAKGKKKKFATEFTEGTEGKDEDDKENKEIEPPRHKGTKKKGKDGRT